MIALDTTVDPAWTDYNGHLNDGWYAILFSRATDALMDSIGLDDKGRKASGQTIYTLETHVRFLNELKSGTPITIAVQILEFDTKRLRIFLTMKDVVRQIEAATSEQMLLSVDLRGEAPKSAPWLSTTAAKIAEMAASQVKMPFPASAGQGIALKRK